MINELRIGNYIQYRDKSSLLTVESLGSNGFSTINQDGIQYGSDDICEYNGIPLTEEWLLKFGFVKNEDEYILGHLSLEDRSKDIYSKDVNKEDFGSWFINSYLLEIEYVHQLQNLYFALTGEELQLK